MGAIGHSTCLSTQAQVLKHALMQKHTLECPHMGKGRKSFQIVLYVQMCLEGVNRSYKTLHLRDFKHSHRGENMARFRSKYLVVAIETEALAHNPPFSSYHDWDLDPHF